MAYDKKHLGSGEGDESALVAFRHFLEALGAPTPDDDDVLGVTLVVHLVPDSELPQKVFHGLLQFCRAGTNHELLHDAYLVIGEALDDLHSFDPSQN